MCMTYVPPFNLTIKILNLSKLVANELGRIEGANFDFIPFQLRKKNSIKIIHSSLAIEGNSLSIEQITDIIDGKKIKGPKNDILEVQNAITIYRQVSELNPLKIQDLLYAHKVLMKNLIEDNGKFRTKGVGILNKTSVAHIAPSAKRVGKLIEALFKFLRDNNDIPWVIKSCIFHYELEFIHPFSDGNGRIGRLWQQLLLIKENPIFEAIPIESLIKEKQKAYYKVLGECDAAGESTVFIEFLLSCILESLKIFSMKDVRSIDKLEFRLEYAFQKIGSNWFSRKEYMQVNKSISTATASRDLLRGIEKKVLTKKGDNNKARYQYIT